MNQHSRRSPRGDLLTLAVGTVVRGGMMSLLLLCGMQSARAQTITPPGPASLTHDGADANQTFSEASWNLQNGSIGGATANWTCGPFVHVSHANHKADCRLAIRLISSESLSGWTITKATDETNHGGGDQSANVTAQSTFSGTATVGLTVTFVQQDFSILTAGNYQVTVTGTITAN